MSASSSSEESLESPRDFAAQAKAYQLPAPGERRRGQCQRPPGAPGAALSMDDPAVSALVRAGRAGAQCDPPVSCHFCGRAGGRHLYLYAEAEDGQLAAGYLGWCDHLLFDGSPWCDYCYVLGHEGGAARASCAGCCGVSWGRPDEGSPLVRRLALWRDGQAAVAMTD